VCFFSVLITSAQLVLDLWSVGFIPIYNRDMMSDIAVILAAAP